MNNKIKELMGSFDYLEQRWSDEKEYEDWNDYTEAMTKAVEKHNYEYVSLVNSPAFKLTFKDNGKEWILRFKKGNIELVEVTE